MLHHPRFMLHTSQFMLHASYIMLHDVNTPCFMLHDPCFMLHASQFMHHVSYITLHASCFTLHTSRFMHILHASRYMPHDPCMLHASCIGPCEYARAPGAPRNQFTLQAIGAFQVVTCHLLTWFPAPVINLRLGTKRDINGTSVGVPPVLLYSAAKYTRH